MPYIFIFRCNFFNFLTKSLVFSRAIFWAWLFFLVLFIFFKLSSWVFSKFSSKANLRSNSCFNSNFLVSSSSFTWALVFGNSMVSFIFSSSAFTATGFLGVVFLVVLGILDTFLVSLVVLVVCFFITFLGVVVFSISFFKSLVVDFLVGDLVVTFLVLFFTPLLVVVVFLVFIFFFAGILIPTLPYRLFYYIFQFLATAFGLFFIIILGDFKKRLIILIFRLYYKNPNSAKIRIRVYLINY